jgi:vancomycin permeability regulator SanA
MAHRTRVWTAVVLIPVVVLAYLGLNLAQVIMTGRSYVTQPGEVIVVLGAAQYDGRPSPQLRARLDEVVKIYETGQIPWVMVTGGRVSGDRFSEAEASARYLTAAGIPEAAILVEDQGATTYASLSSVAQILRNRGLSQVVLVTDPFHCLRSRLIAQELGLDAVAAPTQTSVVRGSHNLRLHLREALGVAVGRLVGFERLTNWVG